MDISGPPLRYVGPVNVVFYAIWTVARALLPRSVAGRVRLLAGSDWKAQLRDALGPDASARLPASLRDDDGRRAPR